jgi:hypothetical protein
MRPRLISTLVSLTAAAALSTSLACAAPRDQIRLGFSRFIAAQNAHDVKAVDESLVASAEFLWIAPGQVVRGRDAALMHLDQLFKGNWRIDPDWSTLQIMMLDVSTAEVSVRVTITNGTSTQTALLNPILVAAPRGWRVMSVVFGNVQAR